MTQKDFEFIGDFHCGLAAVKDFKGNWGFVNGNFDVVVPLIYEWANSFCKETGVGTVKINSRGYRFIDTDGNFVSTISYDDACNCNGIARILVAKCGNGFWDPITKTEVFYKDI